MLANKRVVTVSVTGASGAREAPYRPVTPREIAQSAIDARAAGAAVVHVHVRDPQTGAQSMDFALYQEVFQRLRDHSDILINLTTGPGAIFIPDNGDPIGMAPGSTICRPEKRVEHVLRLKPDLCSLDMGSLDFGQRVFVNCGEHVAWMAEQIRDAGIRPEMEVFALGHIDIAKHMIATGKVNAPPLFQLCMGIPYGIPATPLNMIAMTQALPAGAIWGGFGISTACFPMVAQATLLGGNIRVGMEDALYLEKGVKAKSNKELVEKAVAILRLLGKEPATPDEARTMLAGKSTS